MIFSHREALSFHPASEVDAELPAGRVGVARSIGRGHGFTAEYRHREQKQAVRAQDAGHLGQRLVGVSGELEVALTTFTVCSDEDPSTSSTCARM